MANTHSLSTVVAALGGSAAVAMLCGVSHWTVKSWVRRGSIPVVYWPALMAKAQNAGLSLSPDELLKLHAAIRVQPNTPPQQVAS